MSFSPIQAVLWDFGGVILSSPFEAFNTYEAQKGLPTDLIRRVNSTNPHTNAWALLERNDISPQEFDQLFATESEALGHRVPGADILALQTRADHRGMAQSCCPSLGLVGTAKFEW